MHITANGTLQWQQTIGGSEPSTPAGFVCTPDGGYLAAGHTASNDGDIGFLHDSARTDFVAKLAPNGNLLYTKRIGVGPDSILHSIVKAEDGV